MKRATSTWRSSTSSAMTSCGCGTLGLRLRRSGSIYVVSAVVAAVLLCAVSPLCVISRRIQREMWKKALGIQVSRASSGERRT